MTRFDSNVYVFNQSETGDIQFYETYRLTPELPLVYKPWGLMNYDLFREANKWIRRKDLSGVNIEAAFLNVNYISIYLVKKQDQ